MTITSDKIKPSPSAPPGSQRPAASPREPSLVPVPQTNTTDDDKPLFAHGNAEGGNEARYTPNNLNTPLPSSPRRRQPLGSASRGVIFEWVDLASRHLMNAIPIILGLHVLLLLMGWFDSSGYGAVSGLSGQPVTSTLAVLPWALAVSLIALGAIGYSALYFRLNMSGVRILLVLAAVWGLCLWQGGPDLFSWYFLVLVCVYPVFLHQRYGLAIPWVAAAAYLSLAITVGAAAQSTGLHIIWFAGALVVIGHIAFGLGMASQHYRKLHKLAHTDELTGLSNRRHFRDSVERELEFVRRDGRPLTLVTYDLDNFKQINDEHGHVNGDVVLRHFADVLRLNTRRNDVVARIGGDEFAVVLPEMNAQAAESYVQSILETLSLEPISIPGGVIALSASAGVVTADRKGPFEIQELMRRADENLYRSKRNRRRVEADSERRKRSLLLIGGSVGRNSRSRQPALNEATKSGSLQA